MSIVWLDLPPSPMTTVQEDMLRQLASQGIIECDSATARVKFTDLGKQVYYEIAGQWPSRNI